MTQFLPRRCGQRCPPAFKPALGCGAEMRLVERVSPEGSSRSSLRPPGFAALKHLPGIFSPLGICCRVSAAKPRRGCGTLQTSVLLAPQTASRGPWIPINGRETGHKSWSSPVSRVKSRQGSVSPGPLAPGLVLRGEHRSAASQRSGDILGKAPGLPFVCSFFFSPCAILSGPTGPWHSGGGHSS